MLRNLKYTTAGSLIGYMLNRARRVLNRSRDADRRTHWKNLQELLVSDPVVDLKSFCGQFEVSKNSHLLMRLLFDGTYEPDLAALVAKHIDPNLDVIDVGANIGFFTCLMAKKTEGRVLAIEPTPGALLRLRNNLSRNQITDKVVIYPGVVSSNSGEATLAVVKGKEEFSSLQSINHPSVDVSSVENITVPAIQLDQLVDREKIRPGFIKMDVEGAEALVLAGAEKTFREYRPILLSELSDGLLRKKGSTAKEVVARLRGWGYDVTVPNHPKVEPGLRPFGDILAIPKEKCE